MSESTNDPHQTRDGGTLLESLPPPELKPEMILNERYKLIKEIGRGGMGVVWKAEDLTAERMVVLKFVPRELQNFESAVAQVKASFLKIHELHHQHICPVYVLEEDRALGYYLVMKWLGIKTPDGETIDGETIDKYVARTVGYQKPLPLDEVVRILRPVAEALDYAHSQGIIHRDIKPSNIFLVLDEAKKIKDVQVIDFGLASEIRSTLTRVSQIRFDNSGTRPYMAPEQWRGNRRLQTGATDQYALGVVAYELLSGYLPFEGDDLEMLRLSVLQDKPEPIAEQPEHVNAALLKALSKDGVGRFGSCIAFVEALAASRVVVLEETKPPKKGIPRPVYDTNYAAYPPGSFRLLAKKIAFYFALSVVPFLLLCIVSAVGGHCLGYSHLGGRRFSDSWFFADLISSIPILFIAFGMTFTLLYRSWAIIQGEGYLRTTPRSAVMYCFIPIFNFFWIFHAIIGLVSCMNKYRQYCGLSNFKPLGKALAIAICIVGLLWPLSLLVFSELVWEILFAYEGSPFHQRGGGYLSWDSIVFDITLLPHFMVIPMVLWVIFWIPFGFSLACFAESIQEHRIRTNAVVIKQGDIKPKRLWNIRTVILILGASIPIFAYAIAICHHSTSYLIGAIEKNNQSGVRVALFVGADINGTCKYTSDMPLHIAARNSNVDMLKYLIDRGANVNAISDRWDANNGMTPLDYANTEEKQAILRVAGGKHGSEL